MLHDFTRHLSHYLSLMGIILGSLAGVIFFPYDKPFQTAVCISAGTAFVVWGIVHHHIHDDLHPKVVLEYIASAALGVVLLLVVIWS
jgi:hypothetical protein